MTSNENNLEKDEGFSLKKDQKIETSSDSEINNNIEYEFGWNSYSESTNGRFAMIGFIAILIIEIVSKESFLNWCGLFN